MAEITARYTLESVALELRSVSEKVKGIEAVLCELTNALPHRPKTSTLQTLQNLDVADQTILALADYLSDVSQAIGDLATIDVSKPISKVPLEALKERLGSAPISISEARCGQTDGQPEIF